MSHNHLNANLGIILCAGFGSRMGKLSKRLPKPLWPFFNETLLSFQIKQLKKIGVKKICLNTHFHSDLIHKYVENLNDNSISCFFEKELLGSGGGITNIIKKLNINTGNLIILNSDAFIDFKSKQIDELNQLQLSYKKILIAIPNEGKKYNKLYIENNLLVNVATADNASYFTYSGCGIFDISAIKKTSEISSFFESIANYKNEEVFIYTLKEKQHYDFGTYDLFFENIMKIKEKNLKSFLNANNINISDFKVKKNVFCFDSKNKPNHLKIKSDNIIILKSIDTGEMEYLEDGIYFKDSIGK